MQVFGLPGHLIRNGRGGVASSAEDPEHRSGEKTRRRGALAHGARGRPDGGGGRSKRWARRVPRSTAGASGPRR